MPCSDGGLMRENSVQVRRFIREIAGLPPDGDVCGDVSTLDYDTAVVCLWCRKHRRRIKSMSPELQVWWKAHQHVDAMELICSTDLPRAD